jgi:hypothetical protein
MNYVRGIGAVDTMIRFPHAEILTQEGDTTPHQTSEMYVDHRFKSIAEHGSTEDRDPAPPTLEQTDRWEVDRGRHGVIAEQERDLRREPQTQETVK